MAEIKITDGITPAMQEMARQFPVEMPKAMLSLAQWLRNKVAAETRAGAPAGQTFGPLSAITLALRNPSMVGREFKRRSTRGSLAFVKQAAKMSDLTETNTGFGGLLTGGGKVGAKPFGLVAFKTGRVGNEYAASVGYLDEVFPGSAVAASRFQGESPSKPISKGAHGWLRERLGRAYNQPASWPAKPSRPIFQPYVNDPVFRQEKVRVLATAITRIRQAAIDKAQVA